MKSYMLNMESFLYKNALTFLFEGTPYCTTISMSFYVAPCESRFPLTLCHPGTGVTMHLAAAEPRDVFTAGNNKKTVAAIFLLGSLLIINLRDCI